MLTIKLEGFTEARNRYAYAGANAPAILAAKINDLAFMVRDAEMKTIQSVFDRPNPRTVRNIKVFKGNKSRPGATIAFNQTFEGEEYIKAQIKGGPRAMKKSEKAFGRYYVPGPGAQLDQYGNIKGSQVTQIISQLKLFGEVGHKMNQTANSAKRRRGAAKSTEYFLVPQKTGGLVPGVYRRVQSGVGFGGKTSRALPAGAFQKGMSSGRFSSVIRARGVIPVLIFVDKAPAYKERFPFYEVGRRVIDERAPALLRDALRQIGF